MCGIVGYFGPQNPKEVIFNGLRALEYRGYDSAGVAILHQGEFKRVRAEGKLDQLGRRLESESFDGHLGIGHTRWATHGLPIERNAHPHCVGGVSIVHNGIIENHAALRADLKAQGVECSSDTDSELVAHLISQEISGGRNLLQAVLAVLPRLEGAYSILAVSKDQPNEMVAFKFGPPLIVGVSAEEVVVASDIQAIVPHTRQVIFLEDQEVAHVQGTQVTLLNHQGQALDKKPTLVDWSQEKAEKQGYPHFMLKEIFEQPRAVAQALAPHLCLESHQVQLDCELEESFLKDIERVFIVGCGTSFYAGLAGEYLIETWARVPVEVEIASEFRYRQPVLPPQSLVVVISQSGETADTLAALRLVKEQGVQVLSICNVPNSSIDREAQAHLYMNAGVEIGVASTKAFVSTLAVLNLLALALAKAKDRLSGPREAELVQSLLALPSHMETVLAYEKFFAEAAESLKAYRGFLYMGRGIHYPIALEGALKLKELAYMHAEGYAAGEMKHGPLALIDSHMAIVMLAPKDELYEKTLSNLEEAKARGGQIISIGTGEDERLKSLSLHYLALPQTEGLLMPLLEVIPLQLLAYHLADSLGHDVDQPRNLAKSVTVE